MYDEHALAAKFDIKEWKRIFPFLKPYKKEMILLVLCAVFCSFIDSVFPLMTKYAINNFIEPRTLDGIVWFVIAFVFIAFLQAEFGSVIYSKKAIYIEMCIGRDMRYKLFRHVQELSVDYFNVTPVGFILARIMNDTNSMGGMFSWRLAAIALQASYLLFVLVNMLVLNVKLGAYGPCCYGGYGNHNLSCAEKADCIEPQGKAAECQNHFRIQRVHQRCTDG